MTWFSREQARRFLFSRIGSVLIFALLIGVGVVFLLQMLRNAARESGYDFTAYLHAATVFLQGGNPYQLGAKFPFIYPLFTCILIVPFQAVPYWLANLCWFGINVTSLGLSAFFLLKIIARALSVRQCLGLALVPILLTINLTQSNLVNGQINFFVMLLCVLFLHALLSERKVLAAALLAAAIAIKLTPLVFLVFLVLRKEFRVLAWTVGFTCLFTLLLPFLFVGSRVFALYDGYLHSFLVARLSDGSTPAELGFNLGAFLRLVFPDLNGAVMFVLTAAVTLGPVSLLQFMLGEKQRTPSRTLLFFVLYMTSILVISPMSETHHLAFLLLPSLVMSSLAWLGAGADARVGTVGLLLFLCGIVLGRISFPGYALAILVSYAFVCVELVRNRAQSSQANFPAP